MKVTEKIKEIKHVLHTRVFNIKDKIFCASKKSDEKYIYFNLKSINNTKCLLYSCDSPLIILNANRYTNISISNARNIDRNIDEHEADGILSRDSRCLIVKKDSLKHFKPVSPERVDKADIIFYTSPLENGIFEARSFWFTQS